MREDLIRKIRRQRFWRRNDRNYSGEDIVSDSECEACSME